MLKLLILTLLATGGVQNGDSMKGPVKLQDEGVTQGQIDTVNCVGAGITCTKSRSTGTVTIGATGGSTVDDQVNIGNGSSSVGTTLPDTTGAGQALVYNQSTNAFANGPVTLWPFGRRLDGCINNGAGFSLLATTSCSSNCNTTGILTVAAGFSYVTCTTSAVSGNTSYSQVANATLGVFANLPVAYIRSRFTSLASRRYWFGLENTSAGTFPVVAASGASAIQFVAIGLDTAVSANFQCCSGDGVNYSCADTGVAAATSVDYNVVINTSNYPTNVSCGIASAFSTSFSSTTRSTNLPAAGSQSAIPISQVTTQTTSTADLNTEYLLVVSP